MLEIIKTRKGVSDFVMHKYDNIELEFLDNQGNKKYLFISRSDQFILIELSNEPLFDLYFESISDDDGPGFYALSKDIAFEIWEYELSADMSEINNSEYANIIHYAILKIIYLNHVGDYSDSVDFSNHARFLSSYYDDVSEKCENNSELMSQISEFYEIYEISNDKDFLYDSEKLLEELLESDIELWNEKIDNFKNNSEWY